MDTKTIYEVRINWVTSAEALKSDLIIVKDGVISVIPITELALARAKMMIANFDIPKIFTFVFYEVK